MNARMFGILLAVIAAVCLPAELFAGKTTVMVDPGSTAYLGYTPEGGITTTLVARDGDRDGIVEFEIPAAAQESLTGLWIVRSLDGKREAIRLIVPEGMMSELEPFDVPSFAAVDPPGALLASIQLRPFLAEGNQFFPGDLLQVLNGSIHQTATVRFQDASVLPDDPGDLLFDENFVNAQPAYTGLAQTQQPHRFRALLDTIPPTATLRVGVDQLWPPNGELVDVGLFVHASDEGKLLPEVRIAVFSDEGDDPNSPDAILDGDKLMLRAERHGAGDGRVYLIAVVVTDVGGNTGSACAAVTVPHSQSGRGLATVAAEAAQFEGACGDFAAFLLGMQGLPPLNTQVLLNVRQEAKCKCTGVFGGAASVPDVEYGRESLPLGPNGRLVPRTVARVLVRIDPGKIFTVANPEEKITVRESVWFDVSGKKVYYAEHTTREVTESNPVVFTLVKDAPCKEEIPFDGQGPYEFWIPLDGNVNAANPGPVTFQISLRYKIIECPFPVTAKRYNVSIFWHQNPGEEGHVDVRVEGPIRP